MMKKKIIKLSISLTLIFIFVWKLDGIGDAGEEVDEILRIYDKSGRHEG